ncbi:Uncharacterised protein [Mycobacterium tuberculosis]|nr:Uncharacterised protein [Mycobacterium tuberculosis]CFR87361.1 Uncharacterised protein [Mycobacterium tuberculosis]CFR96348.1 Uncharacterised protein [Mycobacterium tuberculosis]CFS40744.1 Uncharacterised protein [Mycobacterium tuberculosis]CFV43876.1 Uncharacterised protein [Mycobacterium tuberculosis]
MSAAGRSTRVTPDGASPAPCRAHRSACRRARRAAGRSPARPFRAGTGAGRCPRRGTLAEPTAFARVGLRAGPRRRGVRRHRVPQSAVPDRRDHRHPRRRPVVAGSPGVAAAGGDRRQPRRTVVPHAGIPLGALRDDRCRGGAAPRPALFGGAPASRAVRVLCTPASRVAGRLAGRRPRRAARRLGLATATVARPGDHGRGRSPACPPRQDHRPAARRPRRPAGSAFAVRPHPPGLHRRAAAGCAGRPPRPAPVAAAPQRRVVAGAGRLPGR